MKTADLEGPALEYWFKLAAKQSPTDAGILATHDFGWAEVGPVLERENVQLFREGDEWCAEAWDEDAHIKLMPGQIKEYGPTQLIAIMRCIVREKFGEDVTDAVKSTETFVCRATGKKFEVPLSMIDGTDPKPGI